MWLPLISEPYSKHPMIVDDEKAGETDMSMDEQEEPTKKKKKKGKDENAEKLL